MRTTIYAVLIAGIAMGCATERVAPPPGQSPPEERIFWTFDTGG